MDRLDTNRRRCETFQGFCNYSCRMGWRWKSRKPSIAFTHIPTFLLLLQESILSHELGKLGAWLHLCLAGFLFTAILTTSRCSDYSSCYWLILLLPATCYLLLLTAYYCSYYSPLVLTSYLLLLTLADRFLYFLLASLLNLHQAPLATSFTRRFVLGDETPLWSQRYRYFSMRWLHVCEVTEVCEKKLICGISFGTNMDKSLLVYLCAKTLSCVSTIRIKHKH